MRDVDPRNLLLTVRLRQLYEISKVLTRFTTVEETLPELVSLVTTALPLRSATALLEFGQRALVWTVAGENPAHVRDAVDRARQDFAYLDQAKGRELREATSLAVEMHELPAPAPGRAASPARQFVTLPLVVAGSAVFGVLQLEGAAPLDELDLMFVDAVTGQLAVALDREAVVQAKRAIEEERRASVERTERRQRFLSDMGAVLAGSLDYRLTLDAVARLAVPQLADVCFVDEREESGRLQRHAVAAADEQHRSLAERISEGRPFEIPPHAAARLVQIRPPHAVQRSLERPQEFLPASAEDEELMRTLRLAAMMVVPLHAHGRALGTLVFLATQPPGPHVLEELALAVEVGRRAAMAIDNARLYQVAQRSISAREALLAVVSHDLRTPLTTILLGTEGLLRGSPDERQRKLLGTIRACALQMSRMSDDLLEMASIDAGHLSVDKKPEPAAALVTDAVSLLKPLATVRSIGLEVVEVAPGLVVSCDRERVLQVFTNIIGNALKFTQEGGSITLRSEPQADAVCFSVADTGRGIPAEDLAHLFESRWQGRQTARLGYGLGLAISKGIVESLGGRIWAESEPGRGTTLFFTLPRADGAQQSPSEGGAAEVGAEG